MKIRDALPTYVIWSKVSDWNQTTGSGMHLVSAWAYLKTDVNWVLFYAWCHCRTENFHSKGWTQDWDAGNLGSKYSCSSDGILDALIEFEKFTDTSELPDGEKTEALYKMIIAFCAGVVYKPVPPRETPKPPEPEPQPVPPDSGNPPPPSPNPPEIPPNTPPVVPAWKKLLKVWGPIIASIISAVMLVLPVPGWGKLVLDCIVKIFNAIIGG